MLTVMAKGAPACRRRPPVTLTRRGCRQRSRSLQTRALRSGIESEFRVVRGAALTALAATPPVLEEDGDVSAAIALMFLARFDPDESNRAAAEAVWESYGLVDSDVADLVPPVAILSYLSHDAASVRDAAVGAFAAAVAALDSGMAPVLAKLFAAFSANAPPKAEPTVNPNDPFAAAADNDRKRPAMMMSPAADPVVAVLSAVVTAKATPVVTVTPMVARPSCVRSAPWLLLSPPAISLVSTLLTKVLGDEDEGEGRCYERRSGDD